MGHAIGTGAGRVAVDAEEEVAHPNAMGEAFIGSKGLVHHILRAGHQIGMVGLERRPLLGRDVEPLGEAHLLAGDALFVLAHQAVVIVVVPHQALDAALLKLHQAGIAAADGVLGRTGQVVEAAVVEGRGLGGGRSRAHLVLAASRASHRALAVFGLGQLEGDDGVAVGADVHLALAQLALGRGVRGAVGLVAVLLNQTHGVARLAHCVGVVQDVIALSSHFLVGAVVQVGEREVGFNLVEPHAVAGHEQAVSCHLVGVSAQRVFARVGARGGVDKCGAVLGRTHGEVHVLAIREVGLDVGKGRRGLRIVALAHLSRQLVHVHVAGQLIEGVAALGIGIGACEVVRGIDGHAVVKLHALGQLGGAGMVAEVLGAHPGSERRGSGIEVGLSVAGRFAQGLDKRLALVGHGAIGHEEPLLQSDRLTGHRRILRLDSRIDAGRLLGIEAVVIGVLEHVAFHRARTEEAEATVQVLFIAAAGPIEDHVAEGLEVVGGAIVLGHVGQDDHAVGRVLGIGRAVSAVVAVGHGQLGPAQRVVVGAVGGVGASQLGRHVVDGLLGVQGVGVDDVVAVGRLLVEGGRDAAQGIGLAAALNLHGVAGQVLRAHGRAAVLGRVAGRQAVEQVAAELEGILAFAIVGGHPHTAVGLTVSGLRDDGHIGVGFPGRSDGRIVQPIGQTGNRVVVVTKVLVLNPLAGHSRYITLLALDPLGRGARHVVPLL